MLEILYWFAAMRVIRAILFFVLCSFSFAPFGQENLGDNQNKDPWVDSHLVRLMAEAQGLDEDVLRHALVNYKVALDFQLTTSPILTVVDFTKPSGTKRLWVLDIALNRVLFHEYVSHGRNSGDHVMATRFSNRTSSLQSSLGLFLTGVSYIGKAFGPSLKLHGLNHELNDNALLRGIVLHGAPYVSEKRAKEVGHIGRSYGCFSLRREIASALIDKIKNGTIIYAYHPLLFA